MAYRSPPAVPSGVPGLRRVKPKTPFPGGLRARWKDADGNVYEWDYQHGALEKYDRKGKHCGEFDPDTGEQRRKPTKRGVSLCRRMWVLRQYDPQSDELLAEFHLPTLRREDAEELLGFAPTKLGSTELDPGGLALLVRRFDVPVEQESVASFLDFDGEPEPVAEAAEPAATALG